MKIDFESIVNKLKNKANSIFNDNGKLNNLLSKTKKIINENGELDNIINDIKLLIQLVKDYKNKRYTQVSKNSIIMVIISLIYLVSPIDLIPDFLVGGFIDDAAVIAYVLKKIQLELEHYKEWKNDIIDEDEVIVVEKDDDIRDDDNGYHNIPI